MKLYCRIKVNGKWTFRAACDCGGYPPHTKRSHDEDEGGEDE